MPIACRAASNRMKKSALLSFHTFLSSRLIADIYRIMLSDKKYGLSVNIMATRVMPSLLPQTVNPSLNLEQFTILLEVSGKASSPTITHNHRAAWYIFIQHPHPNIGNLHVRFAYIITYATDV